MFPDPEVRRLWSVVFFHYICNPSAQMAKLVDALCSGRSVRKDVLVRIQFWAQTKKSEERWSEERCPPLFIFSPLALFVVLANQSLVLNLYAHQCILTSPIRAKQTIHSNGNCECYIYSCLNTIRIGFRDITNL